MAEFALTDNTSAAIEMIDGGGEHFIAAVAERIRSNFEGQVHVVTGAMQASASVITATDSDYGSRVAAAAELNPRAEFAPEEQVEPGEAIVQVPVGYAAIEELGSRYRPGHPALIPAVEAAVADAEGIAREVFGL